jgi:hypothetical protein
MTLDLRPVRVATGIDEEGMLVFDGDQRLVAVLTHLSEQHDGMVGHWFLEAGFGRLDKAGSPVFADLDEAQRWISGHLGSSRSNQLLSDL